MSLLATVREELGVVGIDWRPLVGVVGGRKRFGRVSQMAQGCEGRVTNGRQEEKRTDAQETKRVQQGKVGPRSATRLNAGLNPHVGQVGQDPG